MKMDGRSVFRDDWRRIPKPGYSSWNLPTESSGKKGLGGREQIFVNPSA